MQNTEFLGTIDVKTHDKKHMIETHSVRPFSERHIPLSIEDISRMLNALEQGSVAQLLEQTIPSTISENTSSFSQSEALSEHEALNLLKKIASKNQISKSFIGMGYHGTYIPSVILRNLLENPGWYTAYTPYQAEVSQGRLELLLVFQQMILDLTGMEIANASLLDEATAAAEAMTFCMRASRGRKSTFLVSEHCHPQTLDVLKTRATPLRITLHIGAPVQIFNEMSSEQKKSVFGALFQYPESTGSVTSLEDAVEVFHEHKVLVGAVVDPLSLALLKPPGEQGVDVVIGSSQRFGVPMGYGGPHAAFFATRDAYKRSIPGRLIGVSVDRRGRKALRMALQTREQHIRREKATSNICTAQVLLAMLSACYAIYHGPKGITSIAESVHQKTQTLAKGLKQLGFACNDTFFDTLTIDTAETTESIYQCALKQQVNLRNVGGERLGITLDETSTDEDIKALLDLFLLSVPSERQEKQGDESNIGIPESLKRSTTFLNDPVFQKHHSETEMMRYLKRLEDKDISLNRSMIALGSCTMKLNAATEMIPVTWPEFSNLHPFAPVHQAAGYEQLIRELSEMLMEVTGFDGLSMQPNSGAQGEYTGLLSIARYHQSRGDSQRDLCLIPASAHGTNPASTALAGFKVKIVRCDDQGNVDLDDLQKQAEKHADTLAALMITYPSTHGVFEEDIKKICSIIHEHGGQVYLDGANLNALVGIVKIAHLGADVAHMNLHKTFAIPHGGGGPGMGPIGVKEHLKAFLPGHVIIDPNHSGSSSSTEAGHAVSAAPWGSPSILPISWMYIKLMGTKGLRRATEIAILSANYVAQRLSAHYPILYTGKQGRVAHECIIDLRPLKQKTGITEEDVAKRLIDFGFHAPTMSFPVPGTLMIEPTESEPLSELDRFCEAMIVIRQEIQKVEDGSYDAQNNPLRNAPHTVEDLTDEHWKFPYSRETAVFPVESLKSCKYWSPVNRIDNVYGDRNLVCSCSAPSQ